MFDEEENDKEFVFDEIEIEEIEGDINDTTFESVESDVGEAVEDGDAFIFDGIEIDEGEDDERLQISSLDIIIPIFIYKKLERSRMPCFLSKQ